MKRRPHMGNLNRHKKTHIYDFDNELKIIYINMIAYHKI